VGPPPNYPTCTTNSQTNTGPDASSTTPSNGNSPTETLPCQTGSNCNGGGSTPCVSPPSGTPGWVTPAIPAGTTWNLTGTGNMTAYLQGNNGAAVTGTLCLGIFVYPTGPLANLGGIVNGVIPPGTPIGSVQQLPISLPANAPPTPVSFDFNLGVGSYAVVSTGLAQIEYVLWLSTSSGPVNFNYDRPAANSELTLITKG